MSDSQGRGPAPSEPVPAAGAWRDRAVARSLNTARSRAEQRSQRFLDAAMELTAQRGSTDFTVQDVVDRAEQSLRSFYQYFGGKQELLLAVYEESMRDAAKRLADIVEAESDPLTRLRTFVVTLYRWCEREPAAGVPQRHAAVRAMSEFAFDLIAGDGDRSATGTEPLFEELVDLLDDAAAAGAVRVTRPRRIASLMLQTVMFNAFATVRMGDDDATADRAEEMWEFCYRGLVAPGSS